MFVSLNDSVDMNRVNRRAVFFFLLKCSTIGKTLHITQLHLLGMQKRRNSLKISRKCNKTARTGYQASLSAFARHGGRVRLYYASSIQHSHDLLRTDTKTTTAIPTHSRSSVSA